MFTALVDRRLPRVLAIACVALCASLVLASAAIAAWRWPLDGAVVERFRLGADPFARGQHRGIDVAAARGTTVRAACGGSVRFAGTAGDSGRTVSATCGQFVVSYLHLEAITVEVGQRLEAGDRLGTVGTSGTARADEPHLHLGVRRSAGRWAYVDPLTLLPAHGVAPPAAPLAPRSRNPHPLEPAPSPAPVPLPRARFALPAAEPSPAPTSHVPRPTPAPLVAWIGLGLLLTGLLALPLGHRRRRRGPRSIVVAVRAKQ